jgi:hypothetical protein
MEEGGAEYELDAASLYQLVIVYSEDEDSSGLVVVRASYGASVSNHPIWNIWPLSLSGPAQCHIQTDPICVLNHCMLLKYDQFHKCLVIIFIIIISLLYQKLQKNYCLQLCNI